MTMCVTWGRRRIRGQQPPARGAWRTGRAWSTRGGPGVVAASRRRRRTGLNTRPERTDQKPAVGPERAPERGSRRLDVSRTEGSLTRGTAFLPAAG